VVSRVHAESMLSPWWLGWLTVSMSLVLTTELTNCASKRQCRSATVLSPPTSPPSIATMVHWCSPIASLLPKGSSLMAQCDIGPRDSGRILPVQLHESTYSTLCHLLCSGTSRRAKRDDTGTDLYKERLIPSRTLFISKVYTTIDS